MKAGLRKAIDVPLYLAKYVDSVWKTLVQMTAVGNINCKTHLQGSSCRGEGASWPGGRLPLF